MLDVLIYGKLTNYCAYRERCTSEIVQKMRDLKIEKSDWDAYKERLAEEGFLNDERFVKSFVSAYSKKKWGKNKIKSALMRKSLDASLVKKYLDDLDDEGYDEQIKMLAERKMRTLKNASSRDARTKLIRFLLGKGFEMPKITAAIKDLKF